MVTTVHETERTYESRDGSPSLDGVVAQLTGLRDVEAVAGPHEFELHSVYYDALDLRLAAAGITLRYRRGGGETGWHVKVPAGGDARDEIQVPGASGRPPGQLLAMIRAFTRGARITEIATLSTTRRNWELVDRYGRALAEVVDDTVNACPAGAMKASAWREIEVELAGEGRPELLDGVERCLVDAGIERREVPAKLARALGDRWPASEASRDLGPSSQACDVVLAYLRGQVDRLRRADLQVRCQAPDGVHQMRVAARKLRSTLQAFGKIVDRDRTDGLVEELRWLGVALGPARDLEVLYERCRAAVESLPDELVLGPVAAQLTRAFSPQRAAADKAALAALDSDRYLTLLDGIDRLLTDSPLTERAGMPAGQVLPRVLERSRRRLARRLHAADAAEAGRDRDAALHEARKAAKRLRYAVTAARPALGKPGKRLARRVKDLQGLLGEHHDTVVARPQLRELAAQAHATGGNGFTFGLLYAGEASRARDCERGLPTARKRVGKAARGAFA